MGLFNFFKRNPVGVDAKASAGDVGSPEFYNWLSEQLTGEPVTVKEALRNTAVLRCIHLISYSIGYTPLHLRMKETQELADAHDLYRLLSTQPNDWQTAFNFRQYLQRNALIYGNGYALIVRSGRRVIKLVPLHPSRVEVRMTTDWRVEYRYTKPDGKSYVDYDASEILHVFADSENGYRGASTVEYAAEAIQLARDLERSQTSIFKNNMNLGGVISHPESIGPEALNNLKSSLRERFGGTQNAGKWLVLEEGMDAKPFTGNSKDAQQIETRELQLEEIGRAFGVPRPFLGVDDTSWGTGVGQLGQMFVQYGLNPWYTAWEQAIARSCLSDREKSQYEAKFDPSALMRGSMRDQGEFFSKALGSGGHQPWMDYEEVRLAFGLPERTIRANPMTAPSGGNDQPEGGQNEPESSPQDQNDPAA